MQPQAQHPARRDLHRSDLRIRSFTSAICTSLDVNVSACAILLQVAEMCRSAADYRVTIESPDPYGRRDYEISRNESHARPVTAVASGTTSVEVTYGLLTIEMAVTVHKPRPYVRTAVTDSSSRLIGASDHGPTAQVLMSSAPPLNSQYSNFRDRSRRRPVARDSSDELGISWCSWPLR
jgi:hypothetical protein